MFIHQVGLSRLQRALLLPHPISHMSPTTASFFTAHTEQKDTLEVKPTGIFQTFFFFYLQEHWVCQGALEPKNASEVFPQQLVPR